MTPARAPSNSGRTMAVGVGVIGVVGVLTLLAILFNGGGTGDGGTGEGAGSGTGPGTGTAATSPVTPAMLTAPTRPMKVTIQESDYLVNGRPVDLEALSDLAGKVPAGSGPAVLVERTPSSRAKAEQDLKDALQKKGITPVFD